MTKRFIGTMVFFLLLSVSTASAQNLTFSASASRPEVSDFVDVHKPAVATYSGAGRIFEGRAKVSRHIFIAGSFLKADLRPNLDLTTVTRFNGKFRRYEAIVGLTGGGLMIGGGFEQVNYSRDFTERVGNMTRVTEESLRFYGPIAMAALRHRFGRLALEASGTFNPQVYLENMLNRRQSNKTLVAGGARTSDYKSYRYSILGTVNLVAGIGVTGGWTNRVLFIDNPGGRRDETRADGLNFGFNYTLGR